ncbi:MAG: glycosyltransferase [Deltaproteobacteria bacterium]|nr:MAG: glycosyltransferase [Deltaproteobacteria bacterium]
MLKDVDVGERSVEDYRGIAPEAILEGLRRCAQDLQGARVLHVNATPYGGGVSELLRSVVPLLNDLGLVADWKIIHGDESFFQVTKAIHNGLQGAESSLVDSALAAYRENAEANARLLEEVYDFVFVHDPQPAGILSFRGKGDSRWVWRCHIDTSNPNPDVWGFLRPYLNDYDAAVFTMRDFAPPDLPVRRVEIIPPAIDPVSPKNLPLPESIARQLLGWIGVRLDRPLVTQISRFDPWKDPVGVIQAYRMARREIPALQLALVGSMALDDPEGWELYSKVLAESEKDPSIHIFTNLTGVGNAEVNAFQQLSDVVVQKSLREGFGLVVSEALWKGTPVVAGHTGGIPLQMADGVGGHLVKSVEECAASIVALLRDPVWAGELGTLGKERVRQHFLLPRLLLNELTLMLDLAEERPIVHPPEWHVHRDPVCGMVVDGKTTAIRTTLGSNSFEFCCEDCRARFLGDPDRYTCRRGIVQ